MPDANQIAAAINLRVRQLEAQGITGIALANHMIGHMQDLHRIYSTPPIGRCAIYAAASRGLSATPGSWRKYRSRTRR